MSPTHRSPTLVMLGALAWFCAPSVGAQATNSTVALIDVARTPVLEFAPDEILLRADVSFETISAVAEGPAGNIYVIHRPSVGDPILVIDRDGRIIRSWGAGLFDRPHTIRIDPAGNVWTVDSSSSVIYKFAPDGSLLLETQLEHPPSPNRPCGAADIAFGAGGYLFVADGYCNARVVKLDAQGVRVAEWGSSGTGRGQFRLPHGIAVGPQGRVFVADRENRRIQVFDQEGTHLDLWQYEGRIMSVAFSPHGELFAAHGGTREGSPYLVQLDPSNGTILGHVPGFGHELAVAPDGSLLPAALDKSLRLQRPPN